jgi:hypothetical protein
LLSGNTAFAFNSVIHAEFQNGLDH